jgi:predicted nucleic acid-binding Zn ribbon protein
MDRLITTLPAILKAAGDSHEVVEATVIAAWRHAAGEGLREHAAPIRLQEKKLIVAVADATWQKQMKSLSGQLLFRLNAILAQRLVTYIELIIAPERLSAPSASQAPRKAHDEFTEATVSLELMEAASRIQDGNLRRVFLGAAISCLDRIEKSQITN